MMGWTSLIVRLLDASLFTIVFLFQSIVLNFFIIKNYNYNFVPYFWFLADFFVLLIFYLTLYLVGCHFYREKKRQNRAAAVQVNYNGLLNGGGERASIDDGSISVSQKERPGSRTSNGKSTGSRISEYSFPGNMTWFIKLTKKFPMAYLSWIFYSAILIAKIFTLFKNEIPQKLEKEDFFGPQMFKFVIGISSLLFSLIVAAHKNARADPLRNAYLNNLCYRIALEILDSASLVSLLLPQESHIMYSYSFENEILILVSINLFLPCMTLYKLCATDFGRSVNYPIELWYKCIHVLVVDGAFFCIRLYFWGMYNTDTSIFIIKNIYAIVNFGREIPADFENLKKYCCNAKAADEMDGLGGTDNGSDDSPDDLQLNPLNKGQLGLGVSLNDGTGYNWKKAEGSISTRGVHGSAQSSLVHVYAANETNGHALPFADSSNLYADVESRKSVDSTQPESLDSLIPRSDAQTNEHNNEAKDLKTT